MSAAFSFSSLWSFLHGRSDASLEQQQGAAAAARSAAVCQRLASW